MSDTNKRYAEIENLLYTKHSQIKKNGIEHVKKILSEFNNPQRNIGRIIHITGTNGKGSVAYITESILRNMGFNTALYTSPHIRELTERIQINRIPISRKDFVALFEKVYPLCENLSFFEIITVIAFLYFKDKVDYSVIEVGIGGLYDTTNVFEDTSLCFITSISLDHTDLLGPNKTDIAFQKAGIIKKNSICVTPYFENEIKKVILKRCDDIKAKNIEVDDFFKIKEFNRFDGAMRIVNIKDGEEFYMGILGIKQTLNLSMVFSGLNEIGLNISNDVLRKALLELKIDCRFETVCKKIYGADKLFVLDGAHNPEAISGFIKNIRFFDIKNPVLVFSVLSTKDHNEIIKKIIASGLFKKIIVSEIINPKKLNAFFIADEFFKYSKDLDLTVISDLDIALKNAVEFSDNICVCGSFYLVSDALKIIKENL